MAANVMTVSLQKPRTINDAKAQSNVTLLSAIFRTIQQHTTVQPCSVAHCACILPFLLSTSNTVKISSISKYVEISQRPDNAKGDGANEMSAAVSQASSSAADSLILTAEQKEELGGYDFLYDGIVLEGGGNKGLAATGAIRVLEELGYWGNIKRFAGASAGSMVAALVAVGYNSHDIEAFLRGGISKVFLDARFGKLSFLPNMLRRYGWHPGKKIFHWFGERVKEKTGNADLTFKQLYKRGTELCITVANMNTMDCTYCHVKTTPDLPIRKAVQMSGCIPGFFCPVKEKTGNSKDYYVDGGLLCNYPIHCYDGWFLSTKPEDSFLQRLQPFEQLPKLWDPNKRFSPKNEKTLGILLYADDEREIMKDDLVQRCKKYIKEDEKLDFPNTHLAKNRKEAMQIIEKKRTEHQTLIESFSKFFKVLRDSDIDHSGTINEQEFEKAMTKPNSEFTTEDKKQLFGDDFSDAKAFFKQLDTNGDGELSVRELMAIGETKGLEIMDHFRGYSRQEITGMGSYFGTVVNSLLLNMKRIFVQGSDVYRTIGINTGYLDTLDFKMEEQDQTYMVQQGKLGCMAFLRELIAENKLVRKTRTAWW
ncbi:uncharacterized protein LOC119745176 [Patiria miniata]|uniref:Uncharacterized protein n=1 Tax=Patiria miniata TaxID=46514 RepID=A0A914BM18_PATMI|nr:uncharacterized protein LOC119745176 [Patiria miniata]